MLNNQDFLMAVCGQVRCKQAHRRIISELQHHIDDQTEGFIAEGLSPDEAVAKAVCEMGDPVLVGQQLDREYRPKPPYAVMAGLCVLLLVGIVFRFTLVGPLGFKDVGYLALAVGLFFTAYFCDFTKLAKPTVLWGALGGICILAVFFIAMFRFKLSSAAVRIPWPFLLLLALPILAGLIWYYSSKGLRGILLCLGATLGLCICFGFLSVSYMFITVASFVLLLLYAIFAKVFGGKRWRNAATVVLPACLPLVYLVTFGGHYFARRFSTALFPQSDPMGAGFMALSVRNALSGSTLLQGAQDPVLSKFSGHMDLQLSSLINNYGWAFFWAICGLLALFAVVLLIVCLKQRNLLSRLLSMSVALAFICQAASYIIFNLGFTLVSPLPLPFITSGFASLVINALLMGLLASALRTGHMTDSTPLRAMSS